MADLTAGKSADGMADEMAERKAASSVTLTVETSVAGMERPWDRTSVPVWDVQTADNSDAMLDLHWVYRPLADSATVLAVPTPICLAFLMAVKKAASTDEPTGEQTVTPMVQRMAAQTAALTAGRSVHCSARRTVVQTADRWGELSVVRLVWSRASQLECNSAAHLVGSKAALKGCR